MFKEMSNEQLKRTVISISVAGTLIVAVLLCVMIYQFICMGVKAAQINRLEQSVAKYEKVESELQGILDYYGSDYRDTVSKVENGLEP